MDKQTARTMVLAVLIAESGRSLSVKDIGFSVRKKYATIMSRQTIVSAIDELRRLRHNVDEQTERRGSLRLPVKVFQLRKVSITEY